ncbi:MAG: MBL fold metallo-hydrolase [Candidatus Pacebacteria bacterium]|nr:MBL fold metallo-hydrolase [Candidatus Paceibacterota bacterium]
MQIIWKGQSCFQLLAQKAKNNQVSIVIDPFQDEIGLKAPSLEADILLITHDHHDHNNEKAVSGSPFLINGPGEYEVKEVYIQGILSFHDDAQGKERGDNTIYTIDVEDLRICHLGDLGQKELTNEQLEKIGEVDVLMIPVGGNFTISAKEALKIMSQIEPSITIPMHYQIPKLKEKLEGVDKFLKSLGIKSANPETKFSIKKKDIVPEEAKVILLKP